MSTGMTTKNYIPESVALGRKWLSEAWRIECWNCYHEYAVKTTDIPDDEPVRTRCSNCYEKNEFTFNQFMGSLGLPVSN